jgi:hypothetical protein
LFFHTAIKIIGGNVYQEPALRLTTTSGTINDVWKILLNFEYVFDLAIMSIKILGSGGRVP